MRQDFPKVFGSKKTPNFVLIMLHASGLECMQHLHDRIKSYSRKDYFIHLNGDFKYFLWSNVLKFSVRGGERRAAG